MLTSATDSSATYSSELPRQRADWHASLNGDRHRGLRAWFWTIAAMTLAIVAIGGITRLTQSGLSIVDWQPLVGAIPPLNDTQWTEVFNRYREYPEYQQLRRGMSLAEFKVIFFWEYLHRLVARLIGIVFVIPCVYFWIRGRLPRPIAWRALMLFGLGAMQGIMGWLMVASGLVDRPSVSHYRLAAHLGLAFLILGYATWLARGLTPPRPSLTPAVRTATKRGLAAMGVLLLVQILWGAFVAGLRAGLIFNTFPLMGGQLLPPSGLALDPPIVNFVQNMTTVQWTHRLLGTIVLAASLMFYLRVRRLTRDRWMRRLNLTFVALIGSQYLLGVLTLLLRVPVSVAVLHQVTAGVIVVVWTAWMHATVGRQPRY